MLSTCGVLSFTLLSSLWCTPVHDNPLVVIPLHWVITSPSFTWEWRGPSVLRCCLVCSHPDRPPAVSTQLFLGSSYIFIQSEVDLWMLEIGDAQKRTSSHACLTSAGFGEFPSPSHIVSLQTFPSCKCSSEATLSFQFSSRLPILGG